MAWPVRSWGCRVLAGLCLLIPILGCCRTRVCTVRHERPIAAVPCCSHCGNPLTDSDPAAAEQPVCADCAGTVAADVGCGPCHSGAIRNLLQTTRARCRGVCGRLHRFFARPRASAAAAPPAPPPVRETPFPRFHPVPKRPVFLPQSGGCGVAVDEPRFEPVAPTPEEPPEPPKMPQKPKVPSPEPVPRPTPLPETEASPLPKPSEGWRPVRQKTAADGASGAAWMFRPVVASLP